MPNPKTGTVTMDVGKAVREAKAGKLEYRTDRGANVHVTIGKKSFDERQLAENYAALIDEIMRAKPAAAKGRYIHSVTLTSTMGPGSARRPVPHKRNRRRPGGAEPEQFQRKSPVAKDSRQLESAKSSRGAVAARVISSARLRAGRVVSRR